jgi:transcription elongation factor GreA
MDKFPMTVLGYAALEAELKRRQQEDRPRIIAAISEARSHGDLSENAEYHAAKESQSHNEGRIAELEDKISRAEVIDVSKLSGETIKFGATVTLIDEDTEEDKTYQIVGENEADVKEGKVSITSPIARALIGKKVGDAVEVNTPGGGKSYEVTKVLYKYRAPASPWGEAVRGADCWGGATPVCIDANPSPRLGALRPESGHSRWRPLHNFPLAMTKLMFRKGLRWESGPPGWSFPARL